uniref:Mediator of RNA polymerase II transcription subunit 1 n=1 Tax=Oryzias latipes TaxID=8090 RepID=A0A3P9K680_ORYLA
MKRNSLISGLQLKFAQRSWNDTLLLVQRCMEKSRIESKPCEPLVRSLERLQDVSVTRSRLEMIAQQQGMGFHVTEDTCYLTADLFYLEVLLPPCGGVQEVKVALHGEGPVVNFAAFSTRLKDLFIQYNIPGDNEIKLKLLESLQFLVRDLQKMSGENLPRGSCPVGAPLSEVPGEMLPACFLLRLKPPVPVLSSFVEKLSLITDVAVAQTDQQWAPLHRLLMAGSQSAEETSDQLDLFTVLLPDGETQRYVFPGASWDAPEQRASVVEAVSFTHPAQVPALLQLLRHQCAVNALLRSCWASQKHPSDSQLFEVRPESSTSFSVTFTHPRTHSLAVCEHFCTFAVTVVIGLFFFLWGFFTFWLLSFMTRSISADSTHPKCP